jgi:hypothetical protein
MLNNSSIVKIIQCKSVNPSIITFLISQLSSPNRSKKLENDEEAICTIIGNIFWLADDLADTANDLKSRTLSGITIKMKNIRHNRNLIFDEEPFYNLLISFVERLLNLFQKLDNKLKSIPISTYQYRRMLEFVRMYVISWLGVG